MARKIEDLYDPPAPVEVVLFGGPHDGQRITIPRGGRTTPRIELAEPADPVMPFRTFERLGPADLLSTHRVAAYQWNGSIQDDGALVYQVIP